MPTLLAKNLQKLKDAAIRNGFGAAMAEIGSDPKVVALSADLSESLALGEFKEQYPERYVEVGIAEQNMIGVAAGLGLEGMIPFACTFACFQPMRNLDQIRTSVCIQNANVKMISSHAGFSFPGDGIQIQALEDIAIMRALPNTVVLIPADALQARELTLQAYKHIGPTYLRLGRSSVPSFGFSDLVDKELLTETEIGKAQLLRQGSDAAIIACGYMVENALQAAELLKAEGVYVSVINMHTIKPLDTATLAEVALHHKKIITVEEHQLNGGLGSAVAEFLATQSGSPKLTMIGVNDSFGDTAADVEWLWQKHGLMPDQIAKVILNEQ